MKFLLTAGSVAFVLATGDARAEESGGDERCLRRLIVSARSEYAAAPRPISPALYTVDAAGAVAPLRLPGDHPLANDVACGHTMLASAQYGAQKTSLEEEGEEFFVASYTPVELADGTIFSVAIWTEAVRTLLPRADFVVLRIENEPSGKGRNLRVAWEAFIEIAGECVVPAPDLDSLWQCGVCGRRLGTGKRGC